MDDDILKTDESKESVEESVEESVADDQAAMNIDPTVKKVPFFTDEDVLGFAVNLLDKALERSRKNGFAAVGFTFTDLQLLHRVSKAALERTQKINHLIEKLRERDIHLALQLGEFREVVQGFVNNSQTLAGGYNEILNTIKFFVEKVINEDPKSTN